MNNRLATSEKISPPANQRDWLSAVKSGLAFVNEHYGWLLFLGLYHLAWSGLGYRWISGFFDALLSRYPSDALGDAAVQVFWAEAQFRIIKTEALEPWLWLIGGILLLRIIGHPLLHAGILYSIQAHHHSDKRLQSGTAENLFAHFKNGMRKLGAAFSLIYLIQIALIGLPLLWLVPQVLLTWQLSSSVEAVLEHNMLSLTAYILYIFIIRAFMLYFMLKKTQAMSNNLHRMRLMSGSNLAAVLILSLLFIMTASLLSAGFSAVAILWPGMLAILLHFLFGFFRAGLLLWEISSCYSINEH